MPNTPSILLWREIYNITNKVCSQFGLTYSKIVPETKMCAKHYGQTTACSKCRNAEHVNELNCNEKVIQLRTHQLKNRNKPLSASTIIRTLAHELAHLREFYHTPEHKALEKEIIEYIKELGHEV